MDKDRKKIILKRAGRLLIFFIVLSVAWLTATFALIPKNNSAESGMINPNSRGFLSEPDNTIDVMMIGNSDAYAGFSPMELWNNKGYTSYVSGEGNQRVVESMKILKSALEHHKLKAVFLETDELFRKYPESELKAAVRTGNVIVKSWFPLLTHHDRWKRASISEMFSQPEYTWHCKSKGQKLSNMIGKYKSREYMTPTKKVAPMSKVMIPFLDEFINICRENDIAFTLVQVPSASSWNYKKHNAVQQFADSRNITFIDLDLKRNEIGFNWKTDTRDNGNHLNCNGAKKVTKYLADYLEKNYSDRLTDHRSDPAFSKWNEDYAWYLNEIATMTTVPDNELLEKFF